MPVIHNPIRKFHNQHAGVEGLIKEQFCAVLLVKMAAGWTRRGQQHTWWAYCKDILLSLTMQRTVRVVLAAEAISAGRMWVTHFFRTTEPFSRLCSSCFPARAWTHAEQLSKDRHASLDWYY